MNGNDKMPKNLPRVKITQEIKDKLIEIRKDFESNKKCAKYLGISWGTITYIQQGYKKEIYTDAMERIINYNNN